jgi:multidrug resistance efflux pump
MLKALRTPSTHVILFSAITGALLVLYAWSLPPFGSPIETTGNAYVRGQIILISPQLAGYIREVAVQDYQEVKAGDLVVQIDDRIFRQKLAQTRSALAGRKASLAGAEQARHAAEARIRSGEAQISGAKAAFRTAELNARRVGALLQSGVVSLSTDDQARLELDQARTTLRQAEAALEVAQEDLQSVIVGREGLEAAVANAEATVALAEIDLENTRVVAPHDGRLGETGARPGQYVTPGMQLVALVSGKKWVIANFKENQLSDMKTGQPVTFTVDAFRHACLTGRIERFSPATGSEFSVLKADNATGNFTKISQRLSVRIAIDDGQPLSASLVPGMSVVVSVDTTDMPMAGPTTRMKLRSDKKRG